jgi:putative component of membrane protein insertase Oxa1/YidC/SpoIIIJ protein YidD
MKGLNKAAAYLITLYQKFISPHKGFRCAASVYYGSASCSQTVKQIILQDGIVSGLARIRQQFNLCSVAARSIKEEDQEDPEKKTKDDCTTCDMTQSGCQTACCLISYWG